MTGGDQDGGLTSAMVAERVARGEVNAAARRTSRSLLEIVRANVLTRSAASRQADVMPLAVEAPCAITTVPSSPSSAAPP